jgi:predicted nucleotide-binding protein (sugar kinase/HSP70/actin superfamily)
MWRERGCFKEVNKLNFSREVFLKKKKEALTEINSFRENFKKRETKVKAELEEAGRTLKGLSEKFRWWGTLP